MADSDRQSIIAIDKFNLDKECEELPGHYLRYATKLADAKDDADRAKAKVKLVEAELELAIRERPDHYGIMKFSEKAVEIRVRTHKKFQDALEELHQADHRVSLLDAMVWALTHKKAALEMLCPLDARSYFAEPRVGPASEEAAKKAVRSKGR